MRQSLKWLTAVALFAPLAPAVAHAGEAVVYHHARVWTGTGKEAESVCVRDGRFAAVGTQAQVDAACPGAKRRDARGKTLVPGLNDQHMHIAMPPGEFANDPARVASGAEDPSLDEVCAYARAADKKLGLRHPLTAVVVMAGEKAFHDQRFGIDFFSECLPRRPFMLRHFGGHGTGFNKMLALGLGLAKEKDPEFGHFGRNPDGSLTGRAWEGAELVIMRRAYEHTDDDELVALYQKYARQVVKWGLTSMADMCTGLPHDRCLRVLRAAKLPIRASAICFPVLSTDTCEYAEGDMVSSGGEKILGDAEYLARGAAMSLPYKDEPGNSGSVNFTKAQLKVRLQRLAKHPVGMRGKVHIHCVGDVCLENALQALEETGGPAVWAPRRVSIEHVTVASPAQVQRMRALKVVVTKTGVHLAIRDTKTGGPLIESRLAPSLVANAERLRSLLDAGIVVSAGADAFGAPEDNALAWHNPWLNISYFTMHPSRPNERITAAEALKAYTWGSAYSEFAEGKLGTIEAGKLADFAILDMDPMRTDLKPEQLRWVRSLLTVVGGNVVWDAGTP